MTDRDFHPVPELPPYRDIKLPVLGELRFYKGKDELKN
jgi:hypothetical protein